MEKNSLLYWYPKIKKLPIPMPKTVIVKIPFENFLNFLDDPSALKDYQKEIILAAKKVGFPLFLRTDLASGKHDWLETCYVEKPEKLMRNIYGVVEANFTADPVRHPLGLPCQALVFREFVELDCKFKAFNGLPIARERRYFIKDGKVMCHHPYWPEDAIRFWRETKEPDNWKEMLAELNLERPREIKLLTSYAEKVAEILEGYWSIDFAKAKTGIWYLIDAALGEESWHPKCRKVKT